MTELLFGPQGDIWKHTLWKLPTSQKTGVQAHTATPRPLRVPRRSCRTVPDQFFDTAQSRASALALSTNKAIWRVLLPDLPSFRVRLNGFRELIEERQDPSRVAWLIVRLFNEADERAVQAISTESLSSHGYSKASKCGPTRTTIDQILKSPFD